MSDSSSFTSIMALVESHLSKTSLQANQSENGQAGASFSLPNICGVQGTASDSFLPPPNTIMQLPRFEVKNSEVTEILAKQVKNMLIAKENKLKENKEKQRLADEMKSMKLEDEDNDYVIDLTASIIKPGSSPIHTNPKPLSSSSSVESFTSETAHEEISTKKVEDLPLCQDLSYVLYQKIKRGRCSEFGKVLCARYRPVAAPYLMTKISNPNVIPFDFSTPSPCDINKSVQTPSMAHRAIV